MKNIWFIYKSNIKVVSTWKTRSLTLFRVLLKQGTLITSIFTQSSFIFQVIWWGHRNTSLNIYVVYIPFICFLCASKNYLSFHCFFNFLKKLHLPLIIWKNIIFTQFSCFIYIYMCIYIYIYIYIYTHYIYTACYIYIIYES